jgi:hypothetical protein
MALVRCSVLAASYPEIAYEGQGWPVSERYAFIGHAKTSIKMPNLINKGMVEDLYCRLSGFDSG